MSESLESAIREAKIEAGLFPDEKYPPNLFHEFIPQEWRQAFWERQLDRVIKGTVTTHEFQAVRGAEDDDECTFRPDGTDATYCGQPEILHISVLSPESEGKK